jgi:hypothetical protein
MPLSKKKKDVGKNIKELMSTGRSRDQSIAIALSVTGQSKKEKGYNHGTNKHCNPSRP